MLQSLFHKPPELKSAEQIARMREAGKLVARAHRICREMAKPGTTTGEIDQAVEQFYRDHGATPLFKGYQGPKVPFPACICASVNEEVVHGIPGPRTLKEGDLFKVDTACKLNGWCADAAATLLIGEVRPEWRRLARVANEVLDVARVEMGRRRWWSEVAFRMQQHAESHGYSMVQNFVGHGIGRIMHENPQVPNYFNCWSCPKCKVSYQLPGKAPRTPGLCDRCSGKLIPTADRETRRNDFRLEPGLVLAVEPMVNMGRPDVEMSKIDHWTVHTHDRMPSAHVEHTFAITADGIQVLTADEGA